MLRSLKIFQLCTLRTSVPPYLAKNVAPLENFGLCTCVPRVPLYLVKKIKHFSKFLARYERYTRYAYLRTSRTSVPRQKNQSFFQNCQKHNKGIELCTSVPPYLAKNVAALKNFDLCTSVHLYLAKIVAASGRI